MTHHGRGHGSLLANFHSGYIGTKNGTPPKADGPPITMTAIPAENTATWLAQPGEENLVSVVIRTFNRLPLVQELLAALITQSWRPLQIIVVDDGSTDSSAEWLAGWQPGAPGISHHIIHRSNGGPASARNLGCTAAHRPLVRSITMALFSPDQRHCYRVLAIASRAGRVLRHPSKLKRLWQPSPEVKGL